MLADETLADDNNAQDEEALTDDNAHDEDALEANDTQGAPGGDEEVTEED